MFANFELSSGGLVKTDVRPKRTRTDLGCFPCRRKKKRCDLSKPECLRCRKSTGLVVCEWPAHASSSGSSEQSIPPTRPSPKISFGDTTVLPFSPRKSSSSSTSTTTEIINPGFSEHAWVPPSPNNSIENCITVKLPTGVNEASPHMSSSQLIQLTAAFDRAIISQDERTQTKPASSLSLHLCLEYPALMHAWLSCGTVFLSNAQPGGLERALLHYQCAVRDLAVAISGTGSMNPEWKLATVLLLYTFESMGLSNEEDASIRVAHLNGAHNLVQSSMMKTPPSSMHQVLLLEAYSVRTVLNRLFQPFPSLPYDYIQRLYETTCGPGSPRRDMRQAWRECHWVGMSSDLCDIGFKLSWLRDCLPLDGDSLIQALSLYQKLLYWEPPVKETLEDLFDINGQITDPFMMKNLLSAQSLRFACLLFCHKLLNPISGPFDPEIYNISRQGYEVLQQMASMQTTSSAVVWPIIILGLGAFSVEEQQDYDTLLQSCARKTGPGMLQRASQFLQRAWAPDSMRSAGFLGPDILLETDLLRKFYL